MEENLLKNDWQSIKVRIEKKSAEINHAHAEVEKNIKNVVEDNIQ